MIEVIAKAFIVGALACGIPTYFLMERRIRALKQELSKSFPKVFVYKAIADAALPRGKNARKKDAHYWNGALSALEHSLRNSEGER